MRRTFNNRTELQAKLEEHRQLGHDIYVFLHVFGSALDIEYIVCVPRSCSAGSNCG